ncbi:sulfate ABC transporter substrate-binding protein [Paenibacillus sp. LMG 31461]|uniref:Sulfate ABC transporter substrate-binding protein n=1 Tax=Paenibacillus plantarum TaxID=2654975 RepID=A0ABX1X594_9BACL|nr:sulfate ABC transporter substrate-binding protein [Paenibacillus plantarum]NOU63569.1 sulfate ABC transporter substrate-binding protein [Paenibacillus plantarum]
MGNAFAWKPLIKRTSSLFVLSALVAGTVACGGKETSTQPAATAATTAATAAASTKPAGGKSYELLNVSYDPTRELYEAYNKSFTKYYEEKTGNKVTIKQSHGGSGKQARSVIDGIKADVVTLALSADIDPLEKEGLIQPGWQQEFKLNSAPYTSTIVLLVRKGNPKGIKDWDDLVKPGTEVITPNPKTSGGARWNYVAAWAYSLGKGNDEAQTKAFVGNIYKNVKVLGTGARDSTITFVEQGIGDVLIAWENEALLSVKSEPNKYEIIYPSISILAEPPVAIVDKVADSRGTQEVAKAYLDYLYSDEGQTIAAENFYRPTSEAIAKKYESKFPKLKLVTINDAPYGGWAKVQTAHFNDGGIFDQIYKPAAK